MLLLYKEIQAQLKTVDSVTIKWISAYLTWARREEPKKASTKQAEDL